LQAGDVSRVFTDSEPLRDVLVGARADNGTDDLGFSCGQTEVLRGFLARSLELTWGVRQPIGDATNVTSMAIERIGRNLRER
jgi:hypothetical protein